jgi:hypothetical protein
VIVAGKAAVATFALALRKYLPDEDALWREDLKSAK